MITAPCSPVPSVLPAQCPPALRFQRDKWPLGGKVVPRQTRTPQSDRRNVEEDRARSDLVPLETGRTPAVRAPVDSDTTDGDSVVLVSG